MLTPSPVAKTITEQPANHVEDFLDDIKYKMSHGELIKSFKALADNIKSDKSRSVAATRNVTAAATKSSADITAFGSASNQSPAVDKRKKMSAVPPTPSSQPTGSNWTLDAIGKNIKAAFHIDPIHEGAIKDMLGLPIPQQITLAKALTERLLANNAPVNDRNNTFESVMNILGNLGPEDSDLMYIVSQPLIQHFYDDLPKPFVNYVGHQYRTADGSENSLMYPVVGKSGTNYTRTLNNQDQVNTNLPSAKDIFEKLLKRPDGVFEEHKGGVNMMLLYLAIIITHDLFYTDPKDSKRNLTTSYLDLSSLYGFNRVDQESVRQMKKGLLKPDQWFDNRLVIQPAGVAALIVVFSRNHNYIAQKLLEINENDRFSYGPGKRLATAEEQDEELFQTARLVNNGCYVNIIVHDYIRTIIGTNANSDFILDPFAIPSDPIYGNAVSIEFNLIYRWHGAIGKEDAEWTGQVMSLLMEKTKTAQAEPGVNSSLVQKGTGSIFDKLLVIFNEHFVKPVPGEIEKGLPIAGAHRSVETGLFPDGDIIGALKAGFNQSASEIGNGRTVPAAMEHVEIAGIQQARLLNVCNFNEFRKFLNLTTLDTFEDFSEKVEVQEALKELYGTPDQVELYAGLMVERTKQTGLRLPYTMSRAILSDAVNLLRNDRILSKELTPSNLTNWGYEYTKGDAASHDRIFPSLLTNLFPEVDPRQGGFTADELKTLFNTPVK